MQPAYLVGDAFTEIADIIYRVFHHNRNVSASVDLVPDNKTSFESEDEFYFQPQPTYTEDVINMNRSGKIIWSKTIKIVDIIGCDFCIASDYGQSVYDVIKTTLNRGDHIQLSFKDVKIISSAFLYSAIGQLYNGDFSDSEIETNLEIADISADHNFLLDRITARAKEYYKNPERFERAQLD